MSNVDKLERLITLTEVLLAAERPLPVEEIRVRVPGYSAGSEAAIRRMFERDKDDLRELGIPIDVVVLPHTDPPAQAYRLRRDDYFLRDPGLDPDELAALHLALQLVQVEGAPSSEALWAFGGAPLDRDAETREPEGPMASLPGDDRLAAILDAIAERAPLSFDYTSRGGERRRRTIDPHRLEFQKGHWYLTGHDHDRDGIRHFRIDRIPDRALERGRPQSFEPPADELPTMPSEAWRYGEGEPIEARVLVDAAYAAVARQQVDPDTHVEERPDGSIVLSLRVTARAAFRSFVLGFLEHAEVLDPPSLRDDLEAWLRAIASGDGPQHRGSVTGGGGA